MEYVRNLQIGKKNRNNKKTFSMDFGTAIPLKMKFFFLFLFEEELKGDDRKEYNKQWTCLLDWDRLQTRIQQKFVQKNTIVPRNQNFDLFEKILLFDFTRATLVHHL